MPIPKSTITCSDYMASGDEKVPNSFNSSVSISDMAFTDCHDPDLLVKSTSHRIETPHPYSESLLRANDTSVHVTFNQHNRAEPL